MRLRLEERKQNIIDQYLIEANVLNKLPKDLDTSLKGKLLSIKKGVVAFNMGTGKKVAPKVKFNQDIKIKMIGSELRGSGEFEHELYYFVLPGNQNPTGKDMLVAVRDEYVSLK